MAATDLYTDVGFVGCRRADGAGSPIACVLEGHPDDVIASVGGVDVVRSFHAPGTEVKAEDATFPGARDPDDYDIRITFEGTEGVCELEKGDQWVLDCSREAGTYEAPGPHEATD